jgi:hypothetical protein
MPDLATAADDLAPILDVVVDLMRSGVRHDVREARRILLHRLATSGDVFPPRTPAPRAISSFGGCLDALASMAAHLARVSAVSAALGLAPPGRGTVTDLLTDRPAGHPATPSIPPVVPVRADLHGSVCAALAQVHAAGGRLPLRPLPTALPRWLPGGVPPTTEALLAAAGRVLEAHPGTVLVDPAADPVVVARHAVPAGDPYALFVRVLDGGTTEPWVARRGAVDRLIEARLVPVEPIFEVAGWYHPRPMDLPTSPTARGSLVRFHNVTGLLAGDTTLGEELLALHPAAEIARSAYGPLVGRVWDGAAFVAP